MTRKTATTNSSGERERHKHRKNNRKLSDKEKAYAEARARIFNRSSDSEDSNSKDKNTSKVTWRNRKQEENDPDFRRGVVRTDKQQPIPYPVFAYPDYPQQMFYPPVPQIHTQQYQSTFYNQPNSRPCPPPYQQSLYA